MLSMQLSQQKVSPEVLRSCCGSGAVSLSCLRTHTTSWKVYCAANTHRRSVGLWYSLSQSLKQKRICTLSQSLQQIRSCTVQGVIHFNPRGMSNWYRSQNEWPCLSYYLHISESSRRYVCRPMRSTKDKRNGFHCFYLYKIKVTRFS